MVYLSLILLPLHGHILDAGINRSVDTTRINPEPQSRVNHKPSSAQDLGLLSAESI